MSLFRPLAVVLCSAVLAACSSTPKSSDPAPLTDFTEIKQLKKVWSYSLGDGQGEAYYRIAPAIDGDEIFIASVDGGVAALNKKTGKKLWKKAHKLTISGGVGVASTQLYVGTADGQVAVLDRLSGDVQWTAEVGGEVLGAPAGNGSVVVVQTYSGLVHGFNAQSGERLWTYTAQVPRLTMRGTSSPRIVRGVALVGLANGRIVALDADTGSVRWEQRVSVAQGSTEIERLVDVDGRLLLIENDQIVVVNGYQGKVIAIDIASGRPLWAKDNSSYVGAAEALGNVYVVDASGGVSAIAEGGRSIAWTQTVLARRILTEPAALSGVVAVGDFDGYLHLLGQLDGQLVGRKRVDSDGLRAPMAVDSKLLYVYGNSGKLVAYKIQDR
ncbi:outer membrane protein assembly factor BamB [Spongiibacter sp.]|uniref:outer membrane protein assembly factor BamB n=1 Tax=Spongiibacter sp. TaxID=2024860 RepID=UPI003561A878